MASVVKSDAEWKARFDELAAMATSLGADATAVGAIRDRAPLRLTDLHEDLLSLMPRKLSARGLARLACTSRQLHALCRAEAERAIKEIQAAGQRDAPLPASLAHLENVFHRLARLCGVRFAPASFCYALLQAAGHTQTGVALDLDAVEKLHVVLSHCRTEARKVNVVLHGRYIWCAADVPSPEDEESFNELLRLVCYCKMSVGEIIARRVHVDQAIWILWSARGRRRMMRTRELLEQHEGVSDEDPDYEVEEDEDGGEVELEELIDGGADAVGVVVDGGWFPSLACALQPEDDLLGLKDVYEDKFCSENEDNFSVWPGGHPDNAECTNPLCCHTRFNCRLVAGRMNGAFWPDTAEDEDRPHDVFSFTEQLIYEPRHIDRLARLPSTGRLQPLTCPRAKRQLKARAGYRKWLKTLHDPAKLREAITDSRTGGVVEGVPFGNRSFGYVA